MNIPVFPDDQHGTAIISTAGIINALHLTGRKISDIKLVCERRGRGGHRLSGASQIDGPASANAILCDSKA